MHKQIRLSTFIVLVIFMVGIWTRGVAQTPGPSPFSQLYEQRRGLAAAAKAMSAVGQAMPTPTAGIPQATNADFIEFDVPGSACKDVFPRCTTPTAINPAGVVTGYYADANAALHGFVRSSDGTFTLFDGPGTTCPSFFSACTSPSGINPQGSITGDYCVAFSDAFTCHGFLRAPDGRITTFDPPGSQFTVPSSIDPGGRIVGIWFDANFGEHAFLRSNEGAFATFDAPGAVNGTSPTGISQSGSIVGNYFDANSHSHGFLRAPDGTITTFDPSGSIYTSANSINPEEIIVGAYQDGSLVVHGFLRRSDGTVTTFDLGSFQTQPSSINAAGTVTGNYQAGTGLHAFIRERNGNVRTFDPPGSETTFANAINPGGAITGWYIDPSFLGHGFIRIPH